MRAAAGTDIAFLAAGLVKEGFDKEDLGTILQYPTDEVVVLNLTGAQVKLALERSVQLFPQPNQSFLQVSGLEATFSKSAPPLGRVTSVMVAGVKLDEGKVYSVAMPSTLARGGLGYFKVWDKVKIERKLTGKIEDVLRGKRSVGSASRWSAQ